MGEHLLIGGKSYIQLNTWEEINRTTHSANEAMRKMPEMECCCDIGEKKEENILFIISKTL